jgi:amidohydrolase
MNHQLAAAASLLLAGWAALPPARAAQRVAAEVDAVYPQAEALYLDLHRHPELSLHERQTAAKLADGLRALGFEVTTGIGGNGVVGLLRNGAGPTVMLRTELDALPVEEKTGLPYASKVRTTDDNGADVAVAHACGHDVHMSVWLATARIMAGTRNRWHGTLMLIAQPAEELGIGADAMLAAGLFTRFPKPDYAVAVHDDARYPAGIVGYHVGPVLANVDTVTITVYGRGGHGARPESTIDPVVIAARIVVTLQTIVAREISPFDPAVVTVGSIHGGTRPNIIPDEVKLELTVRSYTAAVRTHLLTAIDRIAKAEAAAAAAPTEPLIERSGPDDAVVNDAELVRRVTPALLREFGAARVIDTSPEMGAEDFSAYQRAGVPGLFLRIGAVKQSTYDAAMRTGATLPSLHSPLFAPDREPTIKAAIGAEVVALRALMGSSTRR